MDHFSSVLNHFIAFILYCFLCHVCIFAILTIVVDEGYNIQFEK